MRRSGGQDRGSGGWLLRRSPDSGCCSRDGASGSLWSAAATLLRFSDPVMVGLGWRPSHLCLPAGLLAGSCAPLAAALRRRVAGSGRRPDLGGRVSVEVVFDLDRVLHRGVARRWDRIGGNVTGSAEGSVPANREIGTPWPPVKIAPDCGHGGRWRRL